MTKKLQVYKCEVCGNIVEVLHEVGHKVLAVLVDAALDSHNPNPGILVLQVKSDVPRGRFGRGAAPPGNDQKAGPRPRSEGSGNPGPSGSNW